MRALQIRRNRFFKLLLFVAAVLGILFIIYLHSPENVHNISAGSLYKVRISSCSK